MKNNRKFKEIKNSKLFTQRVIRTFEKDGVLYEEVKWFEETEPLELGSLKKPKNTDIKQIRIEVPEEKKKNPFGMFFDN